MRRHEASEGEAAQSGSIPQHAEKGLESATLQALEESDAQTAVNLPVKLGKARLQQTNLATGIVGWEGQDDPEMPLNFPPGRKRILLAQVSAMSFLSPLSSSIVAPGVGFIDVDFDNTSSLLSSFVVSVFILGYVVGPLFLAPASEMYGRRIVLSAANWFFTIWTLACALAPTFGSLIAFRLLAGIGGAGSMTLGGGVIADMYNPEQRGAANALFAMGPLFGPVVGPIVGGFIAERAGWRWIFWVLLCATGSLSLITQIFNRETYAPSIMMRKTIRMSRELDNPDLRSCYETQGVRKTKGSIIKHSIVRPLRLLFLSPVVAVFCIYGAFVYGLLYLLLTTITSVYENVYGWSADITGMAYLGIGVGFFCGLAVTGATSDRIIVAQTKKNNGVYEPEMRLPNMIFFALFVPISFFWYGWAAEKAVHWIVPILGLLPFGFGMIGVFIPTQTYLIDAFNLYSASAVAALVISRSLLGAVLPLAGPKLYKSLGLGWGNSLLGFLALAIIPVPYYLWKYGGYIRKKWPISL